MITRPAAHALLLVLFAVLCSCQTVRVKVDYNDQVDFFDFKTYAWLNSSEKNDKGYVGMGEQSIKIMLQKSLDEKGLSEVAKDKADVLIAVNVIEKDKVYYSTHYIPGFYHYGRWGYNHHWMDVDQYTESTIVLAFIDPKS